MRRLCILTLLLAPQLWGQDSGVRLSHLPANIYRLDDGNKLGTESWYLELIVHDRKLRAWTPRSLTLEMAGKKGAVKTLTFHSAALQSLRRRQYFPTPEMASLSMRHHFSIADQVLDLPLLIQERKADAIESMRATLVLQLGQARITRRLTIPVQRYEPKTALLFPLRAPALVTQGMFNNGGHAHRQTLFAIDVMALTPTYAPMLSGEETNEAVAGWGEEVLAPADGMVAYARNDVPTNPLYAPDEKAYAALPEPLWALAGNCVVIDHGNGEFSGLMHLQKGSVTVKRGDRVRRGEVVGKLGNSGDSYMPHLHYQLTNGALIFATDGLPMRFENLPDEAHFARGTYLTPR